MNRLGVKLELDAGDLISTSGRVKEALSKITSEIKEAEKAGDYKKLSYLQIAKDNLTATDNGFAQDIKSVQKNAGIANSVNMGSQNNGSYQLKTDPEYTSALKNQAEALNKNTAALLEALQSGDFEKTYELSAKANTSQRLFSSGVEEANHGNAGLSSDPANALLKSFSVGQITAAVSDGLNRMVSYMDKSGIISKQASGDVIGAEVEKMNKDAGFYGGLSQTALAAAGTIVGAIFGGLPGAAIGGSLGNMGGKGVGLFFGAEAAKTSTDEASSRAWEQQYQGAHELASLLGNLGGTMTENTKRVREAFDMAAEAAIAFGYSAEDGMNAVKQLTMNGIDQVNTMKLASDVFRFERATGADRNTLTEYAGRTGRYSDADALNLSYAGVGASGMAPAQYTEYLNVLKTAFEDGIDKGFARSTGEIVGNLTYLSEMGGDNKMFKGEQGGTLLSKLNGGFEKATSLSGVNDILAFRAAQDVLQNFYGNDEAGQKNWNKLTDLDNNGASDIKKSGTYIDDMVMLERGGFNPEVFKRFVGNVENAEMGDYAGTVTRLMQQFGLNYTGGTALYQAYKERGENLSEGDIQKIVEANKIVPTHSTQETKMFSDIQSIAKNVATLGQYQITDKAKEIAQIAGSKKSEVTEAQSTAEEKDAKAAADRAYLDQIRSSNSLPYDLSKVTPYEMTTETNRLTRVVNDTAQPDVVRDFAQTELERLDAYKQTEFLRQQQAEISLGTKLSTTKQNSTPNLFNGWNPPATFFTGDGKVRSKNDDELAEDRLLGYRSSLPDIFNPIWEKLDKLSPEARRQINEKDIINGYIPDPAIDKTGAEFSKSMDVFFQRLETILSETKINIWENQ